MEKFSKWFSDLMGKLLNSILEKAVDIINPLDWLEDFAENLVNKFLDKFNAPDVEDKLQEKVLDPIKEWLEKKLGINL